MTDPHQIARSVIVNVFGVQCPHCNLVNNMPYECLPKSGEWECMDCGYCSKSMEYRGWQNGPDIDYHSRLAVRAIIEEHSNGK